MAHLYWSAPGDALELLLAKVRATGAERIEIGRGNGYAVVTIGNPADELVAVTPKLIVGGPLVSAALVQAPLGPDTLWIATEWHGRMLVEDGSLADFAHELFACEPAQAGGRSFLVFDPARPAQLGVDADWDGDDRPWLEAVHGEPVALKEVLANPRRFYGDLVDPWVGGANALFAAGQIAARASGHSPDTVLVGALEDFGFARDRSNDSVNGWRRRRIIDAEAVGFGLDNWEVAHHFAQRLGVVGAMLDFEGQAEGWRARGYAFAVAIALIGLEDPPVVIPVGSVYQQPQINTPVQNLATAAGATVAVPAGAIVPIVLPAFCLNHSFGPPSGSLAPTSLVFSAAAGTQQDVWSGIERRNRGRQ